MTNLKTFSICFGLILLGGCAGQKAQTLSFDARPATEPVVSATNMRDAKRCLDRQMARRSLKTTDIVVGRMPDTTGNLAVGLRDMVIHAVTTTNTISGAFRIIDQPNLAVNGGKPLDPVPHAKVSHSAYNLSGSIVAVARSLYGERIKGGVGTDGDVSVNAGISFVDQLGAVTTGMRLSRRGTNETLYSSQHSLVLRQSERGIDARLGLSDYGATFGVSFDEKESASKAVETLVDLHIIELLGQASGVAYWECLSGPSRDPQALAAISKDYQDGGSDERREAIANGLKLLGYDAPFEKALQQFQLNHDLTPSGRVTHESYMAILAEEAQQEERPAPKTSNITIRASNLHRRLEHWRLEIGLKKGAFVRCYYQADDGVVAMIYPNRFDDARWLAASTTHFLPSTSTEQTYNIGGRSPQFLCFSTKDDPVRQLPENLRQKDFVDLRAHGYGSLNDIFKAYAKLGGDVSAAVYPR